MPGELARCSICGGEHPLSDMVTGHERPEEVPPGAVPVFREPAGWWLEDAEALHREHPRSFFIAPAERRRALRRGELVRLGFEYGPHADRDGEGHAERMWVEVLEEAGSGGVFRGRLRNHPFRLTAMEIGDELSFVAANVLSIDYSDEELGYPQNQWPVVDEAILREDRPPDAVVRGPSVYAAGEEGWWMLCERAGSGPLTESVNLLTDRFPGLDEPLRAGGGVWELAGGEGESARWRRVDDEEVAASDRWQRILGWIEEIAPTFRDAR